MRPISSTERDQLLAYRTEESVLPKSQQVRGGTESNRDWLLMLFEVFKESVKDAQESQRYFLARLEERNRIDEAIQQYMRELIEASQELNEKIRSAHDSERDRQTVCVIQKGFDVGPHATATDETDRPVTPAPIRSETKILGRCDLSGLIKDAEMMRARARNEGDKIRGIFQGWQEKANQVDQQLSAVLGIMKDLGRVGVGGSDLGAS